jgi:hypothetical protein
MAFVLALLCLMLVVLSGLANLTFGSPRRSGTPYRDQNWD